jgi:sugar/nucleoside kinase (ribokinase family)
LRVVRALAVIGPLSRDVVDGRADRIGGGPWYAGRALRALQQPALLVAKCGDSERRSYLPRLAALGLPVALASAGETTSFSFRYDADGNREMRVDALGEPWSEGDEPERGLRRVEWVHVTPLLRGDFPPETLERIARRRRVLLDGHGLVRARGVGPLALDADFDRALLRHVSILKLAEDEARVILDGAVRVNARPTRGDPTGAGDAFSVAYLGARAGGHRPIGAARRAGALVTTLLSNNLLQGRTGP